MNDTRTALLAEFERQHAEAIQHEKEHTRRVEDLKALTDAELVQARARLTTQAETTWEGWQHSERVYAVEDLLRIEAIMLRRAIDGEKAAARDPYAPGGARDWKFEIFGPQLPARVSVLERALGEQQKYRAPHPVKTSQALIEFRGGAASPA